MSWTSDIKKANYKVYVSMASDRQKRQMYKASVSIESESQKGKRIKRLCQNANV